MIQPEPARRHATLRLHRLTRAQSLPHPDRGRPRRPASHRWRRLHMRSREFRGAHAPTVCLRRVFRGDDRRPFRMPIASHSSTAFGKHPSAQSAAYIATELSSAQCGPDGLVLTSTILINKSGRAVPKMLLERLGIPVLVAHHEQDGCRLCAFSRQRLLIDKLAKTWTTPAKPWPTTASTGWRPMWSARSAAS